MIDLVTVTCDRDLPIMLLQADSIGKFLCEESTHWVIIQSSSKTPEMWMNLLNPYYNKTCSLKVLDGKIFKRALASNNSSYYKAGWIDQQLLKLLVADRINSDAYLVLDSKNIFIKPTKISDLPVSEGNSNIVGSDWNKGYRWIDFLVDTLAIPFPSKFWKPYTPFLFKTKTVRKILAHHPKLEYLFDYTYNNLSIQEPVSEFILYSFYTDFDFDKISKKFSYNFWGNEHEGIDKFQDCLDDRFIKILAFHRNFISNHDNNFINTVKLSLISLGLDGEIVNKAFDQRYWQQIKELENI